MAKEKEFDTSVLLGENGLSAFPQQEEKGSEVVDYDYEAEAKKVRDAYIDLLNTYGESSGEVIEERRYPNPRFSLFRISSRRKCPDISEKVGDGNTSIDINLESMEHTKLVAKPYDPTTLTKIFPDDQIKLDMKTTEGSSSLQK